MTAPLRFSSLKHIARSPLHYQHALTTTFEPTPAMRLGTLVHRMVLGGPETIAYDGRRAGKDWEAFKAANDGVEIVTVSERDSARAIADAVQRDRRVTELLAGTVKEQRITGRLHGRDVCGTPDAYDDEVVIDLKTCADARPEAFAWQARKMHYGPQVTWYGDLLGGRKRHILIAVETKAPYPVTVLELTPAMVDMGRRTYIGWIEMLQACELAGVWPGYSEAILPLDAIEHTELDYTEAAE